MDGLTVKLTVDHAKCQGHARCYAVSSELFPIDDDGYSAIDEVEVLAGQEELARKGAAGCPERAITIAE